MKRPLFILVLLIIIILFLSSCDSFLDDDNKFSIFGGKDLIIKTGFSDERKAMLKDDYNLNISEDMVFINGYYDRAFRDPALWIYFKVPEEQFEDLFIDFWEPSSSVGDFPEYEASYHYNRYVDDLPLKYAYLYYSTPEDGFIYILFVGLKPGNSKE